MSRIARTFWSDTSGATAPEYAVVLAFVLVAVLGACELLGNRTNEAFETAVHCVSAEPNRPTATVKPMSSVK